MAVIGVLALQGAFLEHVTAFHGLGIKAVEVRTTDELRACDGLVIPGGESTAISLIAQRLGMWEPLVAWVRAGKPTWGTCAGMILLADRLCGGREGQQSLGGLDVTVERNYFGSQIASAALAIDVEPGFLAELERGVDEGAPSGVFIRAPAIISTGPAARAVAWVTPLRPRDAPPGGGEPEQPPRVAVAAVQGSILATAFHPELSPQRCWHRLFARMVTAAPGAGEGLGAPPLTPQLQQPLDARSRSTPGKPAAPAALSALPLPIVPTSLVTPGSHAASSYRYR